MTSQSTELNLRSNSSRWEMMRYNHIQISYTEVIATIYKILNGRKNLLNKVYSKNTDHILTIDKQKCR